jgi:hypothetical protein
MSVPHRCRIVFTVGGKGGVGKSWLVALVVQWLRSLGIEVVIIDADDETSTTTRFHPDARFIAIRNPTEIDVIVELALGGTDGVLVVDLPARAGEEFAAWFALMPWAELAEQGVRFTAMAVLAGTKDSIEAAIRWREFLGGNVDFVAVLNERDDLSTYRGSRTRQKFAAEGIPECVVPKLDERIASALDSRSWTIASALQSEEPHFLTQLMTRARLRRYRDQVFASFDQIKTQLLP